MHQDKVVNGRENKYGKLHFFSNVRHHGSPFTPLSFQNCIIYSVVSYEVRILGNKNHNSNKIGFIPSEFYFFYHKCSQNSINRSKLQEKGQNCEIYKLKIAKKKKNQNYKIENLQF